MIAVLRWGHRIPRDSRITTHVVLTARAFGADVVYVDTEDSKLEETIGHVVKRFGGPFEIKTGIDWKKIVREWKGTKVHLTMYGEPMDEVLPRIPRKDLLVMVGAEKVPREFYEVADFNVAVGNQPHSEVAALAVFLYALTDGSALKKRFMDPEIRIIPSKRGKAVEPCIQMKESA